MKLAEKVLNKVNKNEGLEDAINMATAAIKSSKFGKGAVSDIGNKDASRFFDTLVELAFSLDARKDLLAALKAAEKEWNKGSNIEESIVFGEGQQQTTKVRGVSEGFGSRKARLTIKEASNMMENMLSPTKGAPFPKSEIDEVYLREAKQIANEAMKKLKMVKDSRTKRK